MKYEMIFGDEALFDGAPEECILAVRMPGGDPIFYLEKKQIRASWKCGNPEIWIY